MTAAARRATLVAFAVATAALVLAWFCRFVQDDAFIAFNYARSLAEGHGLTWFGTRVEGYTDFLWVLWLGLGVRLGADPIAWSYAGGLMSFAVALQAVWRLGRIVLQDSLHALAALLIFASNYSVLAFATGGLETMLQTALVSQAVARFAVLALAPEAHALQRRRCLILSTLLAGAILTRLDSVLMAAVLVSGAFVVLRRTPRDRQAVLSLFLPVTLIVGAWLLWKLSYYGDLLPNTYHAKVKWDPTAVGAGALYLWRFLTWYGLVFVWAGAALAWLVHRLVKRVAIRDDTPPDAGKMIRIVIVVVSLLWCAYVVAVGGDFMEFRMLVPAMPFICIVTVGLLRTVSSRYPTVVLGIATVLLSGASLRHARSFKGITDDRRLDSVHALGTFYLNYEDGDWGAIGRVLGEQLEGTDATLALHAVGAIPYYSRLPTLDMYGLNDRDIARNGLLAPPDYRRPGHQRQVSVPMLRARKVNLVLGHPTVLRRNALARPEAEVYLANTIRLWVSFGDEPIGLVTVVAMPLPTGGSLLAWYLTPSPAIDAVIAARGWEKKSLYVQR